MNGEKKRLPIGACFLLIFFGLLFDFLKTGLDLLFVGFILDPIFVTPVAAFTFAIILSYNGVSMFSGKRWASGWINLIFSFIPVLDFLPDWTAYALYLSFVSH